MTFQKRTPLFVLLLLVLLACLWTASLWADGPLRVAIIPFKVNAERDLSFLRDGIVDMLTTRLSWQDKVVIIERQATEGAVKKVTSLLDEETAKQIGTTLKADYVLFGSLTVFGESVSLDAKMVDVHGVKPAVTIFNQSHGMDTVIPNMNVFALAINEKVFGRAPGPSPAGPSQAAHAQVRPSIYAHPEKLLEEADTSQVQTSSLNPNFVVAPGQKETSSFWKSPNFDKYIKGIAVGDVDGDSKQEIVFVSQNHLYVYRLVEHRFIKIKEVAGKPSAHFIGVDVSDINGNGRAEIFVTNLDTLRNTLDSFVLEWNAGDFVTISENNYWYYRILDVSTRGTVLLGQKRGTSDPFLPGIYVLAWRHGKYEPSDRLKMPRDVNVFSFTMGDVMNNGKEVDLIFNEDDYLQILTKSGSKEWKSDEHYGGSVNYLDVKSTSGDLEYDREYDRLFLPQRIFIKDLNRDGKQEVIVIKNHAAASRLFKRFRQYSSSEIVSLSWNGLGLILNWKTKKIHGYVSDFYIADFDNDGQEELVAAVVISKGTSFFRKAKSAIIGYDLTIPKA